VLFKTTNLTSVLIWRIAVCSPTTSSSTAEEPVDAKGNLKGVVLILLGTRSEDHGLHTDLVQVVLGVRMHRHDLGAKVCSEVHGQPMLCVDAEDG
jgi:hypothetical protein